ncbi:hypothetical protein TSMEX_007875 [Taenia solium]|eukprot:TsM_000403800 transcript=TsM_000403800 gene=TsM_000403800
MSGISRAVEEHRKVVSSWCPQTSVWALAHGATISGLCVAGSSYMVLIRMRQFFNLYSQQYFLGTLLPVVALPSVGCIILQDVFVNRKLVNGFSSPETRKSLCSTCLEVRGSFIQTVAGVVAPILFSMSSCASASISYRTFPIPELTNYRKVFGLVCKACGSLSSTLFLLTLVNAIVGGFITEKMVEQHKLISAAQENMK